MTENFLFFVCDDKSYGIKLSNLQYVDDEKKKKNIVTHFNEIQSCEKCDSVDIDYSLLVDKTKDRDDVVQIETKKDEKEKKSEIIFWDLN